MYPYCMKYKKKTGADYVGKKVLFFGDAGIDDTIALSFANLTDEIDVVGIVADYGNVPREVALRNISFLLQRVGKTDIPIYSGAKYPISGEAVTYYPDIHGPHGLGPITPDVTPLEAKNLLEVMEIIRRYGNELIIVNTGRLSSLAALTILQEDEMNSVQSYYIMGGAFLYPGNVTPVAEANFYSDTAAANVVMRHLANTNIFPLNVTQNAIVTPAMVNQIHARGKTTLAKPLLDYYYRQYQQKVPGIQGSPVHDALTMMAVIRDDLCTFYHSAVAVENEGVGKGQSIGDFRFTYTPDSFGGRPQQRIAMELDYAKFYYEFMKVMAY